MKKKKQRKTFRFEEKPLHEACPFCKAKKDPDYKEPEMLLEFISDRAKILGRERSGICARHQRKLTIAMKRARHLALLPYAPQI